MSNDQPLKSIEDWEDFVEHRYAPPGSSPEVSSENATGEVATSGAVKAAADYRNYDNPARDSVREFYRLNHTHQTYDFVLEKEREFLGLERGEKTVWEQIEYLNTLIDDSDPDTDLSQLEHLLQTAEAIRAAGHPDWMVLTGLIHDLGKVLCLYGEPQWAVVGDTFPVGCAFDDSIVYPEFFQANPDSQREDLSTPTGIYEQGCGLRNVHMSWGHDEYMYHVVKDYLPEPALYMIRYHSFYPWHREGAYDQLLDDHDREMLPWVRKFNPFDLYSKTPEKPNFEKIRPYYEGLMDKYLPAKLAW